MSVAAIILAGGSGTRLQRRQNKVYLPVDDRPLLTWSLRVFERCDAVETIVLVVREGDSHHAEQALSSERISKLDAIVTGGATRHDSETAGLDAVAGRVAAGDVDLIAVHDAARPFVSSELLGRLIQQAHQVGGAIPGLHLERPVYRVAADGTAQPVASARIRRVQTPQVFRAEPLLRAYQAARGEGFSGVDTAASLERYGDLEIAVVPGDARNIKVTYADDLLTAEQLAEGWSD